MSTSARLSRAASILSPLALAIALPACQRDSGVAEAVRNGVSDVNNGVSDFADDIGIGNDQLALKRVFFASGSTDLSPEARGKLDALVTRAKREGSYDFELVGFSDASGAAKANLALSRRRAEAVAAYLTGKGVPRSAIDVEARGEANPRVDEREGAPARGNRRVRITLEES